MVLIFPPGWSPASPFLALPQLKGFLNYEGYDVEIVDENICFFDNLISTKYFIKNIFKLEKRWKILNNIEFREIKEQEEFIKLTKIFLMKKESDKIDIIKNNFREGNFFLDKDLDICFGISSLILEEKYRNFNITCTGITNSKYSQNSIEDLKEYLRDDNENLYISYFLEESDIFEKIKKHDEIGISITGSTQLYSALTLAKLIRKQYGVSKKIFFGGNFITRIVNYYPEKLNFFLENIDFISVGDGEYTLKSLIEKKEYANIPNIVYLDENNKLIYTHKRYFELRNLVIPNFDGFPLKKYLSSKFIIPIFSSRSCYSNCTFCTIAKATSGPYRIYSVNQIVRMILTLQKKYNCNFFTFVDETFSIERLIEFSKKILEMNITFYWYTETRIDRYITLEEAKLIYDAGCRKMQFGIESYNQKILDLMGKKININNIKQTIHNFLNSGIGVHLFFMIGFPGETRDESQNTFKFINEIFEHGLKLSNNKLITIGFGSFGLEMGSYIQGNPDDFQIKILTDYTNLDFVGLGLEYEVLGEFLNSKEISSIVFEKRNSSIPSFYSYGKSLFSEIQNFLEIILNIEQGSTLFKNEPRILQLNNGLEKKNDCKYILFNLAKKKIILINNEKLKEFFMRESEDIQITDKIIKKIKFKLNPFVYLKREEFTYNLINTLNGDLFNIEEESANEMLQYKKRKLINQKKIYTNSNYSDFIKYIIENNILY